MDKSHLLTKTSLKRKHMFDMLKSMKVVKVLEATCSTGVSNSTLQVERQNNSNKGYIQTQKPPIRNQAASRPLASSALSFRLRTSGSCEEMAFHPYSPGTPLY